MTKVHYLAAVSFSILLLAGLGLWWSSGHTFLSVEFGLAELSPKGSEGGYAMPASGASTPSGLSHSCASDGSSVTLRWNASIYQGYLPTKENHFANNISEIINRSIGVSVAYAGGGGGGGGGSGGGGGGGSSHGHSVPAPVTYDIYLNGGALATNQTANSYQASISPDTNYTWGVRACSGGGCSSTQSSSFSCPGTPTLNLTADDYRVWYDTGTNLNWSSTNTNSCTTSGGWSGSRPTSGSEPTGNLREPTTYIMQCTGSRGDTQPDSVTIDIENGQYADINACKNVVYKKETFCINYNTGTSQPQHCVIEAGSNIIAGPFTQSQGSIDWSISGETTFTLNCEEMGNFDTTTVKVLPEFQET